MSISEEDRRILRGMKNELDNGRIAGYTEMWWKGKLLPLQDFYYAIEHAKPEDFLMCHKCCRKFKKVGEHAYKGDCVHTSSNMTVHVLK